MEEKKNGQGSFLIQIRSTENATWQGTVLWTEKNCTQNFRSALELLKLISSAVEMQKKEQ